MRYRSEREFATIPLTTICEKADKENASPSVHNQYESMFIDQTELGFKVIAHTPDCKQNKPIEMFKRD